MAKCYLFAVPVIAHIQQLMTKDWFHGATSRPRRQRSS